MVPPVPRRRAEARPDEILEAALQVFVAKGFDVARMEDVAARAGISKAGLYLYFPSKEALIEALVRTRVGPVAALIKSLAADEQIAPADALRRCAELFRTKLVDREFFAVPRLVLAASVARPEITHFYRDTVIAPARAALAALIARGVKLGEFRPVDPLVAARAFVGPLLFEAVWRHVFEGPADIATVEADVAAHMDLLLTGLGVRAP